MPGYLWSGRLEPPGRFRAWGCGSDCCGHLIGSDIAGRYRHCRIGRQRAWRCAGWSAEPL